MFEILHKIAAEIRQPRGTRAIIDAECLLVLQNRVNGKHINMVRPEEISLIDEATIDTYDDNGSVLRVLRCWQQCSALGELELGSEGTYQVHQVTPSARSTQACPKFGTNCLR
jgi:hypothetical protein